MILAAAKAKTPQEARSILVRGILREERRKSFDTRARDEIIAYYRDGTSLGAIEETLKESPLYDYYGNKSPFLEGAIRRTVAYLEHKKIDVGANEKTIREFIRPIFKEEFTRELERWIRAVKRLEEAGCERDEIVALLSQEPVSNWDALSRRHLGHRKVGEHPEHGGSSH